MKTDVSDFIVLEQTVVPNFKSRISFLVAYKPLHDAVFFIMTKKLKNIE
jgi:hypothetical protein